MPDVSIIIINYCTENLIQDCINSIIKHTFIANYEIIIVDNASPNDSFSVLINKYKETKNIICHRIPENIGFGRANNEGYKIASGRYIFCLNPDTELKNNAIDILSEYLDSHQDITICGGNLFHRNGKMCTSFRMLYPSITWELNLLFNYIPEILLYGNNRRFNTSKEIINVAYITGADLMIRKSYIDEAGFYDPNFFMYYEDTELCYRAFKKGNRITNVPHAEIFHYEGKSFKNLDRKAKYNYQSREIFYNKHYNKLYHFIADFIFLFALLLRIIYLSFCKNTNILYWKSILKLLLKKYLI